MTMKTPTYQTVATSLQSVGRVSSWSATCRNHVIASANRMGHASALGFATNEWNITGAMKRTGGPGGTS